MPRYERGTDQWGLRHRSFEVGPVNVPASDARAVDRAIDDHLEMIMAEHGARPILRGLMFIPANPFSGAGIVTYLYALETDQPC